MMPVWLKLISGYRGMLEVKDLQVFYSDAQALWDISIRVRPQEICTLVGANGAGKTTLLKAICGLVSVGAGSISLLGKDLNAVPANERVSLGLSMVPEGRKIFTGMTVEENLKIGAYVNRVWNQKEDLLEKNYELFPRLKERRNQLGGTLSGGERQMLAIARALMSKPDLLFLDEPSLGLSPKFVEHVMEIVRSINDQGVTIMLVEQNINIALGVAQRGYVLESGRIVMQDDAKALLNNPHVKEAYLGM
jgi:branched-chain amino acid transport system ATP-binding protein